MCPSPLKTLVCAFLLASILLVGCAPVATPEATPEAKSTQLAPSATSTTAAPASTAEPTVEPTQAEPQAQAAGEPVQIRALKMFTAEQGWAVDTSGHILRTESGPALWQDVTPSEARPEADTTRAVAAFLDMQQAWSVFYIDQTPALAAGVDVWHTRDGGGTWEKLGGIPATEEMGVGVQMAFVDEQHGWFLGQIYPGMSQVYAELFATTDGGATWTLVSDSSPAGSNPEGETLQGSYSLPFGDRVFTFISPETGFASVKDLARTDDGGKTWKIQELADAPSDAALEQPYSFVTSPQFINQNDGSLLFSLYDFNKVACPPCDVFDGLPEKQVVYVTHNGGGSWALKPSPGLYGSLTFLDGQQGWYLGIQSADQVATTLYATKDGGDIWTEIAASTSLPLGTRLDFVSDQVGFATNPYVGRGLENFSLKGLAGVDAYLYQTLDGGQTWSQVAPMVTR